MDTLSKTIKKLNEEEYQDLLSAVAGRKNNKPYMVIEAARNNNYDEAKMIEMLGVNPSAYYTLKSRLNEKIAAYLSKNMKNPISVLKEKVALVPAMLFSTDKEVSIRSLINLEKELLNYDLSNELITVYKALARLSIYNGDYDFYEREYNRHVAYSLAVVKAEDLFFEFNKRAGVYLLSNDENDYEALQAILRELTNISELYHGHRLFVLYNVVRIYFLCINTSRKENLYALEVEVDNILQQIRKHFETYELDTFYQGIRPLVDMIYFEYYTKTGNMIRAEHYYQSAAKEVPNLANKSVFNFYLAQFLNSKVERYLANGDISGLCDLNNDFDTNFDTNPSDPYPFITLERFFAICKFYTGDYAGSAKTINHMRNEISFKKYFQADVECKLFQALNYTMTGEDGLCNQLLQSVKRQISDAGDDIEPVNQFMRLLKIAIKPDEFRRKVNKLTEIYEEFNNVNTGNKKILAFLHLDESALRRMANPIKD